MASKPNEDEKERSTRRTPILVALAAALTFAAGTAALPLPANGIMNDATAEDTAAAARQKTKELLAQMNRKMHKSREVFEVRVEKYREIRSEPVLKKNVNDYAGTYEVGDAGYFLVLKVGEDGQIHGSGSETRQPSQDSVPTAAGRRRFLLRNARIVGALLTATKVYDDGAAEPLEGVFITRTERDSPADAGRSSFGLGAIGAPITAGGGATRRDTLFYEFKR